MVGPRGLCWPQAVGMGVGQGAGPRHQWVESGDWLAGCGRAGGGLGRARASVGCAESLLGAQVGTWGTLSLILCRS